MLKCKDWNVASEITILLILTWVLAYVIISTVVLQASLLSLPPSAFKQSFCHFKCEQSIPPLNYVANIFTRIAHFDIAGKAQKPIFLWASQAKVSFSAVT